MAERPKRRTLKVTLAAVIVLILVGVTGGGGEGDAEYDAGAGAVEENETEGTAGSEDRIDLKGSAGKSDSALSAGAASPKTVTEKLLPPEQRVVQGSRAPAGAEPEVGPWHESELETRLENQGSAYEDLVASCTTVVSHACSAGELDRAARALREAEAWPLDPGRRARITKSRAEWQAAVDACLEAAFERILAGHVGETYEEVSRMADAQDLILRARIERVLRDRDWPTWRVKIGDDRRAVVTDSLERGREVRVLHEARWWTCKVVEERRGEVTVRIRSPRGDLYPVFLRAKVQPLTITSSERLDQAAAAILAGDALRAALWLASAKGRKDLDIERYADLCRCLVNR